MAAPGGSRNHRAKSAAWTNLEPVWAAQRVRRVACIGDFGGDVAVHGLEHLLEEMLSLTFRLRQT